MRFLKSCIYKGNMQYSKNYITKCHNLYIIVHHKDRHIFFRPFVNLTSRPQNNKDIIWAYNEVTYHYDCISWRHIHDDVTYHYSITYHYDVTMTSRTTRTSLSGQVGSRSDREVGSRVHPWPVDRSQTFDSLTTVKPLTHWPQSNLWPVDRGHTFDQLTAVKPLTRWPRSNFWPVDRGQTFEPLTAVRGQTTSQIKDASQRVYKLDAPGTQGWIR